MESFSRNASSKHSIFKIPLNSERFTEDRFVASMLHMNRSVITRESGSLEERFKKYCTDPSYSKVTSKRWRDSITTVERRGNVTNISTSPSLIIYTDELLSAREKEQRRLSRKNFEKNFEADLKERHLKRSDQDSYKKAWYSECEAAVKNQKAKRACAQNKQTSTDDSPPAEPQPLEGDVSSSRQTAPMALNESASQTVDVDSVPPISSRDSASQTAEGNVDGSRTPELPSEQQVDKAVLEEPLDLSCQDDVDSSKTPEMPSEQPVDEVVPEKTPPADDHVFRKPFPPDSLPSTKKGSKTDKPLMPASTSKTLPPSPRRSPRLAPKHVSKPDAGPKSDQFEDPPSANTRRKRLESQSSDDARSSSKDRST